MKESHIKLLFEIHFFELMIISLALFALYHINKFKPFKKVNNLYAIYSISCILFFLLSNSEVIHLFFEPKSKAARITFELWNAFFCVAELYVFSGFFVLLMKNNLFRKVIIFSIVINSIFFLYLIIIIFDHSSAKKDIFLASVIFNICELVTLFVYCIFFYYRTMQTIHSVYPKNKAILWIVNSLLFYIILALPFFFILEEIRNIDKLFYYVMYSLHFISIGNLLLFTGLAFRAKKVLTE